MSGSFDADVVVVGCGPVGVTAALRCAQRGLDVIAVDRATDIYPLPRAIGMDEETQELLARAGLIEQFRQISTPLPGAEFVDADGNRVVGFELRHGTVGALGHPPMVTFDQPSLECDLRDAAREAGVDIRLGVDVRTVEDIVGGAARSCRTHGVQVEVSDSGGTASLSARWLIGADGAKSTIRSLRGIDMIDQGFDQTWLVVDTTLLDPGLGLPRLARQQCDPARICTLVPGPDRHRRWEFRLRPDEHRDDVLEPEAIADLLAPWGRTDQLQVDRSAVYRFHANVAATFRDGPVFLAGDAAHQMPPFNGQGMCSGMRDAENLSWKLATVASGRGGDQLLDTYDGERRPHATACVAHSVDSGLLIEAIAHDGDAALDTGYGQRPFPKLTGAMFSGERDAVGAICHDITDYAGCPGKGWLLVRVEHSEHVPSPWTKLNADVVDVSADAVRGQAAAGETMIVRPDRRVVAVTVDLAATTRHLMSFLQVVEAERAQQFERQHP